MEDHRDCPAFDLNQVCRKALYANLIQFFRRREIRLRNSLDVTRLRRQSRN
jgi:hypothetical protein